MSVKGQVGGDHYKKLKLEPFEVTLANFGYDGLAASVFTEVQKYMQREKGDHIENLNKAKHCIDIQIELYQREQKEQSDTPVKFKEKWSDHYGPPVNFGDNLWEALMEEYPEQREQPSYGYMYGPVFNK